LGIAARSGIAIAGAPEQAESHAVIKLTSTSIKLPFGDRVFSGGKSAKVANSQCLMCHSRGMIDLQPPLTSATWIKEVEKMRKVYGCPMRDDQVEGVAQFIFNANKKSQ
jgi:hypothetical protein